VLRAIHAEYKVEQTCDLLYGTDRTEANSEMTAKSTRDGIDR
jgi:hypothetical protein